MSFNTPILYLVFNRPDLVKITFEKIKEIKPKQLFIAADGPREDRPDDIQKCKQTREYILSKIDWNCDVKTLFREKNLGCKYAVSSAITWFFENVEMGIILEDDCLPSQSFFWFCQKLLEKYKDDQRIMQINGSCFLDKVDITESYFFSKYNHIWGWASWRRAWNLYELENLDFEHDFEKICFHNSKEKKYWHKTFIRYFEGKVNTWDYPWTFSVWKNNGLAVYPSKNMIKNIGFREDSTHIKNADPQFVKMNLNEINCNNIIHPAISLNRKLDLLEFEKRFAPKKFISRIISKIFNS